MASAKAPRRRLRYPYKVLVVTSTSDATSAAGITAITNAVGTDGTVSVPAPADVGAQFTPANLDTYRAVVFLNTGIASPLTDAQRSSYEAYFQYGGGFVGIGSAVDTNASGDSSPAPRHAGLRQRRLQTGTVKVFDRVHDASKNLPEYWDRTENFYNFSTNVRGLSHVLATVVEEPFEAQPGRQRAQGHRRRHDGRQPPDLLLQGLPGRPLVLHRPRHQRRARSTRQLTTHLKGAIGWAAGQSNAQTSDCGATVLKNFQEVKVTQPPNLNEPVGFDQLPGRPPDPDRPSRRRAPAQPRDRHDDADRRPRRPALPDTLRVYTNSEDGLYGPAVDPNFATDKWVYLYYAPQRVTNVKLSTGQVVDQVTPNTTVAELRVVAGGVGSRTSATSSSRASSSSRTPSGAHLDLNTEQQLLRVNNNRQECCHVAGDIDFDKPGNLWMVTGDDTPAGGIRANGFGPFEDELTDEQQTVRTTNATGGTFTLSFNGQTTAPIPYNATGAQIDAALEALSNVGANNIQTSGAGNASTAVVNVFFRRALAGKDVDLITADGAGPDRHRPDGDGRDGDRDQRRARRPAARRRHVPARDR